MGTTAVCSCPSNLPTTVDERAARITGTGGQTRLLHAGTQIP